MHSFQRCRLCCEIVEDVEDKIVRFHGGLRHEIHYIVYHKEFYTINHLFQLTMLVEKNYRDVSLGTGATLATTSQTRY
jgi:hypothetical protein